MVISFSQLNDQGLLRVIWLYLKPIDIYQLFKTNKTIRRLSFEMNRVVPQELSFEGELDDYFRSYEEFDDEYLLRFLSNIVLVFPVLSKLVIGHSFPYDMTIEILMNSKSFCDNIVELKIKVNEETLCFNNMYKLKTLIIYDSWINKLVFNNINSLISLTSLDFSHCQICDTICFSFLTKLTSLAIRWSNLFEHAEDNQIFDTICFSFLTNLTSLTILTTCETKLSEDLENSNEYGFLSHLHRLTSLDPSCNDSVDDIAISNVSSLVNLTFLDISNCSEITDVGVSYFSSLTNLTALNIRECCQITDNGISVISSLTNITSLDLMSCIITDRSLSILISLNKLMHLDVGNIKGLTSEGFGSIKYLTCMTSLNLYRCEMNQLIMSSFLPYLTKLKDLNCSRCEGITRNGLSHISLLTNITSLNLENCRISDSGLSHISSLTKITSLNLGRYFIKTDLWGNNIRNDVDNKGYFARLTTLSSIQFLTNMTYLDLSGCRNLNDDGFSWVASMTKIKYLNLFVCEKITSAALFHISSLLDLTELRISVENDENTNRGFQYLCNLSNLEKLSIVYTNYYEIQNQNPRYDINLSQDVVDKFVSIKNFSSCNLLEHNDVTKGFNYVRKLRDDKEKKGHQMEDLLRLL